MITAAPPFAYYGGKGRLADRIVALMPSHRVYVEPFAGSLAVLFARPERAPVEIVNDIDRSIAAFWRMLRDQPDDLERVCRLTPHSRSDYLACVDLEADDIDDLERARRCWARIVQSFGKSLGSTSWSVSTADARTTTTAAMNRYLGRFAAAAERLAGVTLECCDAVDLIERMSDVDGALIYADPPYLSSTRTRGGGGYHHDGDDGLHERLAEALNATKAKVIISGYPSEMYDGLYEGWHSVEWAQRVGISGISDQKRPMRIEKVWLNYDPPAAEPSLVESSEMSGQMSILDEVPA